MFRNAPVAITGNIPHCDTEIFAVLRIDIARNAGAEKDDAFHALGVGFQKRSGHHRMPFKMPL
jgi:hypothetical protein